MIGFFGKLPGSADFVAYNAAHKDIRELDGWWQQALHRMAERDEDWQASFDAMPLCFFHYRTSGGAWLMGAMTPSQDASGRRYPLLVFQRLAVSPVVEGSLGVHTLSETFASQLRELLREVMHYADPQAAQGHLINGLEALRELDESDLKLHRRLFVQFLENVRYVDLTRALKGSYPELCGDDLARRMQTLRRQLADGSVTCAALPLPPERALKRPAADLWLYWLEHDNTAPARVSVIVDDFMRPTLLRFAHANHDALRVLAGTATDAMRGEICDVRSIALPSSGEKTASDTLGMGAYIIAAAALEAAQTSSRVTQAGKTPATMADHEVTPVLQEQGPERDDVGRLGDTFKDDSAST